MLRFLPYQRIKKGVDFSAFYSSYFLNAKYFTLKIRQRSQMGARVLFRRHLHKCDLQLARIGIITSKKVGNAVKRNWVRRIVREAFRLNPDFFDKHCDYLFIAKKPATELTSKELATEFLESAKIITKSIFNDTPHNKHPITF